LKEISATLAAESSGSKYQTVSANFPSMPLQGILVGCGEEEASPQTRERGG
jgi:hypothetical protein